MRVKVKPVSGSWRVILPVNLPYWLEIAQIRHETFADALEAAKIWARAIARQQGKERRT